MISINVFLTVILLWYANVGFASSKFNFVHFCHKTKRWRGQLRLKDAKYRTKATPYFENEVDAAKALNQLCISIGMQPKNQEINGVPIPSVKIKFFGVLWTKRNNSWLARFWNGEKEIYGGYYPTALEAAKAVNNLCEESNVQHKNANIGTNPNRKKPHRYKKMRPRGVNYDKQSRKWEASIQVKRKKFYGGRFEDIEDARRAINKICETENLPPRFPEVGTVIEQKEKKLIGAHWKKTNNSWVAVFCHKGKIIYGGVYETKLDAARRVNEMCEENNIPHKNANIGTNVICTKRPRYQKSNYKGMGFSKLNGKYVAQICKNGKPIYGGVFTNNLDAAKRANELCDEHKIPRKNKSLTHADEAEKNKQDEEIDIEFDENVGQNLKKRKRKLRLIHSDMLETNTTEETVMFQNKNQITKKYFSTDLLSKEIDFQLVSN